MKLQRLKYQLIALIAAAAAITPTLAADVGVSISVGQPGFYGHIDIGNFPPPVLIYPQPVVIQRPVVVQTVQPIYLHVPPGHAKNWSKHCAKYDACSRPVYFVEEFSEVSDNGVVGRPELATAEKGEKFLDGFTKEILHFIDEFVTW
jgi:hypothetical protein